MACIPYLLLTNNKTPANYSKPNRTDAVTNIVLHFMRINDDNFAFIGLILLKSPQTIQKRKRISALIFGKLSHIPRVKLGKSQDRHDLLSTNPAPVSETGSNQYSHLIVSSKGYHGWAQRGLEDPF